MSREFKRVYKDFIADHAQFIENELARRPTISYPDEVLNFMKLLTVIESDTVDIFGSYIYKDQLYASDIDIYEEYNSLHDIVQTSETFFLHFKKMVKRVLSTPLVYYSETKCGIDERYNINIGECSSGVYKPSHYLAKEVDSLYARNLLEKEDYDILQQTIHKNKHGGDDYDIVNFILRKYYILRWSSDEILRGYKLLRGNVRFKMIDGLQQDSLVKIDIWSYVNNKLLEITNVYLLSFTKNKKLHNIQAHNDPKSLTEQIEKFYYSNMWYNPFKVQKRSFSYLRQARESPNFDPSLEDILNRISEVVSGQISSLYQNKAEIDTTILLLEKYGHKAITDELFIATDKIKSRLASLLYLTDEALFKWCHGIDYVNSERDIPLKIAKLDEISREMSWVINSETIDKLNDELLNPPNRRLLPEILTYDPHIIRRPDSYVVNPLTKHIIKGGYSLTDDDMARIAISRQYIN
jgi:hypothetical protein